MHFLQTTTLHRVTFTLFLSGALPLMAANFSPTNIVVERMSAGTTPLTSAATPVFVDEYLPAAANQPAPVQSIILPNATVRPTASPFNLLDSGSATSDGQLTCSVDGTVLLLPGYNAIKGDLSIVNSGGTTNRVIGVINDSATVGTSNTMNAFTNGNNFRSVVSVNGSAFWCAGAASDTALNNLSGGIVYYTNSTALKLVTNDTRYLGIFGGQLYFSTQNAPIGIYALGTGLPTSGSPITTEVISLTTVLSGTPSPVAFQFNAATNICYVADSRATKGGVFKLTYNGSSWVSNYLFGTTLIPNGANGLAVNWSGANPVLFITTLGGTNLIAITDSNANATATILAKADGGTNAFRGVALAPLPVFTLTYAAGTGGTISGATPQIVIYGGNGATVTAEPKPGYSFVNWSDGVTPAARTDTAIFNNTNVTANFAINSYTLNYLAGTGGTIAGTSPQTVNFGSSGTTVTAEPNPGYTFVSWSDGVTTAARTDTAQLGGTNVTANFAINSYTLTYTPGMGGTISGTSSQTVNYGSSGTTVTAVPNTGYYFTTWSDGVTTAARTDTAQVGGTNVTANFSINSYTLTYLPGTGGTISGATPQTVFYGASGTTVTAVPNTGYYFMSWSDGIATMSRTDTDVVNNTNLTANFAPAVVTNANDNGAGSLRQIIATAGDGTTITFTNCLSGATIMLSSGELLVTTANLIIDGSGLTHGITINGGGTNRVFEVNIGANVTLNSLTITNGNDTSDKGGGGILNNSGATLSVSKCTLAGNSSIYQGGGIASDGTLMVNQSTLSGNSAPFGGGICNSGTLTLNQSTLSGNSATNFGGGIYITTDGTGEAMNLITNSIVAENAAASVPDIYCNSETPPATDYITFGGSNIVQFVSGGTVTGTYLTNAPLLNPLGNYGGPTQIMPPLAGSPAIGAGSTSATNLFATDQRGLPRSVNGLVDIGAVEFQWALVTTLPASNLTASTATLNANITVGDSASVTWFYEYGLTTNYGNFSTTNSQTRPCPNGFNPQLGTNNVTSLSPNTTYHYQALVNDNGSIISGGDGTFTTSAGSVGTPPSLTGLNLLGGGNGIFRFNFTNITGGSFRVFASTDISAPFITWTNLGYAVESPLGSYSFSDPQFATNAQRFYRVVSP